MRPSEIKDIIWDWNGTIIDDFPVALESINTMLDEHRLPGINSDKYRNVFGFPVRDCYIGLGFDVSSEPEWDRISRRFHDIYAGNWHKVRVRPGIPELLGLLTEQGMKNHILSASEKNILERQLSDLGIRDHFHSVHGLDDIYGSSKLDQGRRMLSELDIDRTGTLLIGDTMHDHEVAEALGVSCLLLSIGHQAEWRLKTCGCRLVGSIDDLHGLLLNGCGWEAKHSKAAFQCVR